MQKKHTKHMALCVHVFWQGVTIIEPWEKHCRKLVLTEHLTCMQAPGQQACEVVMCKLECVSIGVDGCPVSTLPIIFMRGA